MTERSETETLDFLLRIRPIEAKISCMTARSEAETLNFLLLIRPIEAKISCMTARSEAETLDFLLLIRPIEAKISCTTARSETAFEFLTEKFVEIELYKNTGNYSVVTHTYIFTFLQVEK